MSIIQDYQNIYLHPYCLLSVICWYYHYHSLDVYHQHDLSEGGIYGGILCDVNAVDTKSLVIIYSHLLQINIFNECKDTMLAYSCLFGIFPLFYIVQLGINIGQSSKSQNIMLNLD